MEISYALRAFEQSEWGLKEGLNMGGFIMKYADLGPLVKPLTDAFWFILCKFLQTFSKAQCMRIEQKVMEILEISGNLF